MDLACLEFRLFKPLEPQTPSQSFPQLGIFHLDSHRLLSTTPPSLFSFFFHLDNAQDKTKPDAPRPAPQPGPLHRAVLSLRARFRPQAAPRVHLFSLPLEILILILTAAFGNRTIHIELSLRRPPHSGWDFFPWPKKRQPRNARDHGGVAAPLTNHVPNDTKPEAVVCWTSVCHQVEPVGDKRDEPGTDRRPATLRDGAEDRCLHGEASKCYTWRRKKHRGCDDAIDAMGWLLSCKEA